MANSSVLQVIGRVALLATMLAGCTAIEAQPMAVRSPPGPYALTPGDRLRIKVFNEPELTGEYTVGSQGDVSMPLVGSVPAQASTVAQFERSLQARLASGVIRDPRVSVEVIGARPVYVIGEVKTAGEYPYRAGMTALDAVALAGGFTYRANESKVLIRPAGGGREEVYSLDAAVPLYPGDNIRITERLF